MLNKFSDSKFMFKQIENQICMDPKNKKKPKIEKISSKFPASAETR